MINTANHLTFEPLRREYPQNPATFIASALQNDRANAFVNRNNDVRFTVDGSNELESRLMALCNQVREGVQEMIPVRELEGLVLGVDMDGVKVGS